MNLFTIFLIYMLGVEIVQICLGLLLFGLNLNKRLGLRLLAMSVIAFNVVPLLCAGDCDGSCGNWTCPNYHKSS